MRSILLKSFSYILFIVMTTLGISFAQSSSPGQSPSAGVDIIGGYSLNYLTPPASGANENYYMLAPSPSLTNLMMTSNFYNYLQQQAGTSLIMSSNPKVPPSPVTSAIGTLLTSTSTNKATSLNLAFESYFPLNTPSFVYNIMKGKASGPIPASNPVNSTNALNMNSLIAPVQYDSNKFDTTTNAQAFINYIANLYSPPEIIDFSKIIKNNELTQALQMQNVKEYLYAVRRMAANYSVGLSNLYYLYNERVPQPTQNLISSQFSNVNTDNLPANLQKNASPLAIEQWIATHRLTQYSTTGATGATLPTWVQKMETASPATLQRETVYLLAEIQMQLFKQRMVQERLLATQSIQQLQSAGSSSMQLQQLQRSVCGSTLFKNVCPSAPTSPAASGIAASKTST